MKGRPSMLRWLLDNLNNIIISIVLAVLVWIVAVQETNPSIERLYPSAIPIVSINQPAGMVVYDESARTVRVTLSAPQTAWDVLTPDRISATIDLSQQVSGTLDLPVNVSVDDRTVRITKVEPSVVRLRVEPIVERKVPVDVNVVGQPSFGYVASPVDTTPMTVTTRGPASQVELVAAGNGQLSIQDARSTVSQTVSLSPRTAGGQLVPNVTLIPSTTLTTVQVKQQSGFRDLAVKIDLRGNVASGYLISNVSVNPQIVTVFGSPTTLDELPGFIATEPVTVTDATQDVEDRIQLRLPSGVSMLGDPFVQVSVKVTPIESSLQLQRPIVTQGLQPGLSARLSPEQVDVILSGPIPRLDALRADDIAVVVNLLNLDTGTHLVTPEVSKPDGITVVSVLPSTVQVIISEEITPTVTITATTGLTLTSPLPSPTPLK
jgi:YbbR domain-containing protein